MLQQNVVLKLVLFISTVCWCSPTIAADNTVYESLGDVQIGVVFFSPEKREQLDRKRFLTGAAKIHVNEKSSASRRRNNSDAAGYIVGRSGQEKIYVRGDFVAAERPSSLVFPGEVEIKKSTSLPQTTTADDDSDSLDLASDD